ncbi:MAG: hypothetical protein V7K27_25380 [Nostoc sp.]|uniref:hypothetical protein n=1 Tax=Nostoc sp. TaxID=1180 RepID=UPI002FF88F68
MTRYPIPTETPPQNGFTLTTDDHQPEVESLNWESQMSRLVGFEQESSTDIQGSEGSVTAQEFLSQPQEVQTKEPFSSNPFAKLALVGAATLAIVLVGGVFLSKLMSTSNQKPKNIVSPEARSQPISPSNSQQLGAEVDTLKTKLALTEQAQMVKAAQQQLRIAKSTPTVALQKPSVSSRDREKVIPTPAPAPTVYVPQTVPVERVAPLPLPSPQVVNTQPVANITPPAPPSPLEEWRRLAKLGSYGQVNTSNQPIAAAPELPNNSQAQEQTPNPNPKQTTPPPEVSQAQPQGQKTVAVGSSAQAVLATAIFGETTTKSNGGGEEGEDKNVFVIRLKEALKSTDGAIALPANTEFLAEIRSLSEQGLLQMNVVKVISHDNGNLTERSLSNNAIILRGTQGKPLIANKFPNQGSSIASMDAGLFILGGIGKAAELVNLPDTHLQAISSPIVPTNTDGSTNPQTSQAQAQAYTSYTTVTEPRRNLAAGVLEGGLNSVVPQIAQRNQQAIAQMSQQTNVWFLPAGTNIEVYVNQPTQF